MPCGGAVRRQDRQAAALAWRRSEAAGSLARHADVAAVVAHTAGSGAGQVAVAECAAPCPAAGPIAAAAATQHQIPAAPAAAGLAAPARALRVIQ